MKLTLGNQNIEAISVGGWETCIGFPAWKLCFDIGHCPLFSTKFPKVFFTHCHSDHMGGVQMHCATRELKRMTPTEYWLPRPKEQDLKDLFSVWRRLNGSDLECAIHPLDVGDVVPLDNSKEIHTFQNYHTTPSLGYALVSKKQQLLPELRDFSSNVIRDLRLKGVTVTQEIKEVEAVFCGDTAIDVLDQPLVRQAKVLILEVTFLEYERVTAEGARKHGHIHIDHILERASDLQNQHILFTHFSSRYTREEVIKHFQNKLPQDLEKRVTLLLPE